MMPAVVSEFQEMGKLCEVYTMATGQFQQNMCLWSINQDPKDSKEPPLYAPRTEVLIKVPKGSTPAHMEGPLSHSS